MLPCLRHQAGNHFWQDTHGCAACMEQTPYAVASNGALTSLASSQDQHTTFDVFIRALPPFLLIKQSTCSFVPFQHDKCFLSFHGFRHILLLPPLFLKVPITWITFNPGVYTHSIYSGSKLWQEIHLDCLDLLFCVCARWGECQSQLGDCSWETVHLFLFLFYYIIYLCVMCTHPSTSMHATVWV